jgi:16S rRNA (uracil1498-N3)-methyltransferase
MRHQPRYRLSTVEPLASGRLVKLSGNAAHYLAHVLRLSVGDRVGLFNRGEGEFAARITHAGKKTLELVVEEQRRAPDAPTGLTVCFAPIKGGRMETIIEKATELGADVLQPVLTSRSVVDKVNLGRAEAIAREAAEQCERTGWPEIREPVKLLALLGGWPSDMPLIYGDESGSGVPVTRLCEAVARPVDGAGWAILVGPEGGFTPEEFAALGKVKSAYGVGLGPRILRADTAAITLCAATLMAWGDWHRAPRFTGEIDV